MMMRWRNIAIEIAVMTIGSAGVVAWNLVERIDANAAATPVSDDGGALDRDGSRRSAMLRDFDFAMRNASMRSLRSDCRACEAGAFRMLHDPGFDESGRHVIVDVDIAGGIAFSETFEFTHDDADGDGDDAWRSVRQTIVDDARIRNLENAMTYLIDNRIAAAIDDGNIDYPATFVEACENGRYRIFRRALSARDIEIDESAFANLARSIVRLAEDSSLTEIPTH